MLSPDLIERLRNRAADPERRADAPDPARLAADYPVVEIESPVGTLAMGTGGHRPEPAAPSPLPSPASEATVAEVERRLPFPLPAELRQLHTCVADGGFGPGSGFLALHEIADRYAGLCAEPQGQGGQIWPVHLLPVNTYDLGADCYDTRTGAIVYWDEESLAGGPDDAVWHRAFRPAAESLAGYLESWLATAPPRNGRYVAAAEAGFPGLAGDIDMATVEHLRRSLAIVGGQSAAERAAIGLPETGWEEAMCELIGVDPAIYLKLARA